MIHNDKILRRMMLTEKANEASSELNRYTFKVDKRATRTSIGKAVEKTFNVTVKSVKIINVKAKTKQRSVRRSRSGSRPGYKKALVSLKEGQTIELL